MALVLAACGTTSGTATMSPPAGSATAPATASPPGSLTPSDAEALEIDGATVTAVVVPSPDADATYAVAGGGLYRLEEGSAWRRVAEQPSGATVVAAPDEPEYLLRGGHPPCALGGAAIPLEASTDGGATWRAVAGGENVRPLAFSQARPEVVWGDRCGLAMSLDRGSTWRDVPLLPNFTPTSLALRGDLAYVVVTSEGGTSRLLAVDASTPEQPVAGETLLEFWGGGVAFAGDDRLVVGEAHGVHLSDDGGKTWTFSREGLEEVTTSVNPLVEPLPPDEAAGQFGILALTGRPGRDSRVYAGTVRGLYVSDDGGLAWRRLPGIPAVPVRDLALGRGGDVLYATTDGGVRRLTRP